MQNLTVAINMMMCSGMCTCMCFCVVIPKTECVDAMVM